MQSIQIQWRETTADALKAEKYAHFIAIVRGAKAIYIGNAHRMSLPELFASDAALKMQAGDKLFLGRVDAANMRSLSPEVMESLHGLLLFAAKPFHNTENKLHYKGLSALRLSNIGLQALPAMVRAEDGHVFLRAKTMPARVMH